MEQQNQNNCNDKPTILNYYYGSIGQKIDHVDRIDVHFDKDMNMSVDGQDTAQPATNSDDEACIEEIAPCFFGDKEKAAEFLKMARGMKDRQITELVKAWVIQKKISEMSCRRDLWEPLHDHNVYNCTEANWDQQVKI